MWRSMSVLLRRASCRGASQQQQVAVVNDSTVAALFSRALTTQFPEAEVVIAMGSNQGDRTSNLLRAMELLPRYGVQVVRTSQLYETAAAYVEDQPAFLNAALLCRTDLTPLQLLYGLKQIEKDAGRNLQGQRWGPRPLDLDIVFYGDSEVQHESLQVPHVRWHERAFVQAPVVDLIDARSSSSSSSRLPTSSVQQPLQQALQRWQELGGEGQVGKPDLRRVLPTARGACLPWGHRTRIMAIVNLTPDSFSDGGAWGGDVRQQLERVRELVHQGADIVDIGGQSTRPGAQRLSAQEEIARVLPLIKAMRSDRELSEAPVSVDTFYSQVAAAAVEAGASIVNDVSGGTLDPDMHKEVARLGVPYVLMHMRGTPQTMQQPAHTSYACVWGDVGRELQQAADRAMAAGIAAWNLVLDPGVGFAKTAGGNLDLLRNLGRLRDQELHGPLRRSPLLVGVSRKGFLGRVTGHEEPRDRDLASAVAAAAAVAGGASIVRVHNVPLTREVMRVADAIYHGWLPEEQEEEAAVVQQQQQQQQRQAGDAAENAAA